MKKIYLIAVSFFIGAALQVNGSAAGQNQGGRRVVNVNVGSTPEAKKKPAKKPESKRNYCLALTAAALCALAIVYPDESNAVVGAACDGIKNVFSGSMMCVKYVKREAPVFANFLKNTAYPFCRDRAVMARVFLQTNALEASNSMFACGGLTLLGGFIGKSKRFALLGGGSMLAGGLLRGRPLLKQVS